MNCVKLYKIFFKKFFFLSQQGPIKQEMEAERRSPRQWAIDILNPKQPLTLLAFRIIKDMLGVRFMSFPSGTHRKNVRNAFFSRIFLSPNG